MVKAQRAKYLEIEGQKKNDPLVEGVVLYPAQQLDFSSLSQVITGDNSFIKKEFVEE